MFQLLQLVLYADDILLYYPILLSIHIKHLQRDDDALQNYATANYLTFNVPKCKFMLVSRKKQNTNLHPSISVYGSPLDSTTTFKYLGLINHHIFQAGLPTLITFAPRQSTFWDWCKTFLQALRHNDFACIPGMATLNLECSCSVVSTPAERHNLRKPSTLLPEFALKTGMLVTVL